MTHPTPESLRAKVRQAAERGPAGPDLGKMAYPERDEALFGTRTIDMADMLEEMRDAIAHSDSAHRPTMIQQTTPYREGDRDGR